MPQSGCCCRAACRRERGRDGARRLRRNCLNSVPTPRILAVRFPPLRPRVDLAKRETRCAWGADVVGLDALDGEAGRSDGWDGVAIQIATIADPSPQWIEEILHHRAHCVLAAYVFKE